MPPLVADLAQHLPSWWRETIPRLWELLRSGQVDLPLLARWIFQSLFCTGLFLGADFLFGSGVLVSILRRERYLLSPALRAASALALGNGLSGWLLFVGLGLPHWIDPWPARILTMVLAASGAVLIHRHQAWAWLFQGWRRPSWILLAALPVALLFHLDLLYPPLDTDSTMYHMPSARWYAEQHRIRYEPGLRYNAHPQLTVLTYLRAWQLFGADEYAKLANWEYAAIILLCLFALGKRFGYLAALLILTCPVYCWTARTEYADLGLCAALTVTAAVMTRMLDHRQAAALAPLTGLLLGFAASTKLQGLVMAFFLAVAFLALSRDVRAAVWFAAGTILSGAPWWIRSFAYTGSPMAPFFTGDPKAKGMVEVSYAYGFGHDLFAFLMLPVSMITKQAAPWADPFIFGPAMLILVITFGWAVWRIRWRGIRRSTWFLACAILLYALFWFQVGQVMRYLASLLPLMAILWIRMLRAGGLRRPPLWLGLALGPIAMLQLFTPSRLFLLALPPPVTQSDRAAVLTTGVPAYWVIREANRLAAPGDKVYLLFCEDLRYHLKPHADGEWFAERDYAWAGEGTRTTREMMARIRAAGYRYLIVNRKRAVQEGTIYENDFLQTGFVTPDAPTPGATEIYADGVFTLYRLE